MSFTHKLSRYVMSCMVYIAMLAACVPSKTLSDSSHVDNVSAAPQEISTPTLIPQALSPTTNPEQDGCKTIHTISICIQDVKHTDVDTQVKLKILVESNMVSGSGNSFIFPDDERGLYPLLLDEQGRSYPLKDNADNYWAQFDDAQRVYFQTLSFEVVPADTKKITISLPTVAVDSPSEAEGFQLDLGPNPQPGQTLTLNVTTTIDGQAFHFIKAEFGGDGIHSLPVTLYAEPLNLPDDIFLMEPALGDPQKGVFFSGGKINTPFEMSADLVIPPGKSSGSLVSTHISGVLNLKMERLTYWYRGPFEITFQLP